jgi:hypothetical protein
MTPFIQRKDNSFSRLAVPQLAVFSQAPQLSRCLPFSSPWGQHNQEPSFTIARATSDEREVESAEAHGARMCVVTDLLFD